MTKKATAKASPNKKSAAPSKTGSPATAKKKTLKSKKLEDRIAPGMIGSGIVDPGMADAGMEAPEDTSATQDTASTELEGSNYTEAPSEAEGQYVDEAAGSNQYADSGNPEQLDQSTDQAYGQQNDYNTMNQMDGEPSGDYTASYDSWREPDWVTANADGSVHIQPPAGVSVEGGIATFPMSVANADLPIPEEIEIQSDGSVDVSLPEGSQFNAETNTLTMPAGTAGVQDVPEAFNAWENPDGSVSVQLPAEGVEFDAQNMSLNLSNEIVNDMAPSYMEVGTDGSVAITLPEGTQYQADGSFDIPAEQANFMDNPPPEYVQEIEWATPQPDGSVTFEPPQGTVVQDGIATFPNETLEQLPIDEGFTINPDGSADVALPEGSVYNADANSLTIPEGQIDPSHVPEGITMYQNPDGAYTVQLPEGVSYNGDGTVHMNNYWANEMAPDPVQINMDGSLSVELPPQTEFANDGSFTVAPEHADFVYNEAPNYVHDASFAEPMGDGSYSVTPPPNVEVVDGQLQFSPEAVAEHLPLPEEMTLMPDGSMQVTVPEGTVYSADAGALTFPAGSVQLAEIPEGISAHVNPDGSVSAYLPEGITYNADAGVVEVSNAWVNELAPPNVEVTSDGYVNVTLPPATDYQPDGSFVIAAEQADFVQDPPPDYAVGAPEWVTPNPDGSVTFEAPQGVTVDPNAGVVTMSVDTMQEHFEHSIPDEVTFHPDGTMEVSLPEGFQYNAETGVLTLQAEDAPPEERFPENFPYQVLPDGSIAIQVPEGIEINAQEGTVHMDNYWTNQFTPEHVEVYPSGQVEVQMPSNVEYQDGHITVPPSTADFIQDPPPAYAYNGPEWVTPTPDGAIQFDPPPEVHVDPATNTMTMSYEAMEQHFEPHIPDNVTFYPDGSMDIGLPQGATYDAGAHQVIMPAGHMSPYDVPPTMEAHYEEGGTVVIQLPPDMQFQADSNSVHMNNYWANEVLPPGVDLQPDGQVQVQLPDTTHYHPDGSFQVPPENADFVHEPQPEYVAQGPDWVSGNPDGSFTVEPPQGVMVDPVAGTMNMSLDTFNQNFGAGDDVTLHPDGTADVKLPEGTVYDAASNSFTFPAGQMHEIPPEIPHQYNPDGSVVVNIPDGITYNAEAGTVHMNNFYVNAIAPEPFEISPSGQVTIHLPDDTQYFEGGSFVVSPDSAHFMHEGDHYEEPVQQQSGTTQAA